MDTAFSSEDLKFQSDVREFISNNYPKELQLPKRTQRLNRYKKKNWKRVVPR